MAALYPAGRSTLTNSREQHRISDIRRVSNGDATLSTTPWENWELNAEFFTALSRWTLENPETSLDRVMQGICVAIERGREFFEVIPDGAFPARGLVKALAHLVMLGRVVSTANSDIQAFAKDVIRWVGQIRASFEDTKKIRISGQFTRTTWKNLAGMRDLIDEICNWATSRLSDQRWSLTGIINKLNVNKEIAEFKARMAEARAIFYDRSIVSQAWGIDAILQVIWRIFERHKQIEATLRRIQAVQSEHVEEEAERRERERRRRYVTQMLSMHAITNTSYVEQGKPPCDKDTRVDVLKEIMGWVEDTKPGSQNFLWLTGDPGCGKSAVTASLARECKDKGILWAQFFISRNDVNTTNPNAYFPSIARQLAARSDLVELEIHDQLQARPSLMDAMSSEQAIALFIDAIRVASGQDHRKPVVIVIDGLDETDQSRLRSTADIFSHLFHELSKNPNAKIFISSRTEDDIRTPFARTMNSEFVKHLHLDTASESSIRDVSMFLRQKIAQIVLDNDLDWEVWPGDDRMDILATRASGHFIWAVTAANFFKAQIKSWGTECLDSILDKLNSDGMGNINALYGVILFAAYQERTDGWAFESFRRLVGAIVVLQEPLCLDDLSSLMGLRQSSSSPLVDVVRFVRQLRTVLVAGTDFINGRTVPRLHKSFYDFITSDDRVEARFHVDPILSHRELGFQCLRQLSLVRSATTTVRMPATFRYAFRFWSQHLSQAMGATSGIAIADNTLSQSEFGNILQQPSNSQCASPIFMTLSDRAYIQASLGTQTRAWDVNNGVAAFRDNPTLEYDESSHICSSPVAFLPDETHGVVNVSWDAYISFWDRRSGKPDKRPLQGGFTRLSCIAFSPDRNRFVAGTESGDLRMWSTYTGEPIGPSFHSDNCSVTCAALSPTNHHIISGYADGILQLWNVEENHIRAAGLRQHGHTSWVHAIAFSPDGARALSCSEDCTIRLWDIRSNMAIHEFTNGRHPYTSPFLGHVKGVMSATFSPDGKLAVSGSADHTIRFWHVQSGSQVGPPLEGHTDTVWSVEFSPDGKEIVSGSEDKEVRVWDVETRRLVGSPLRGHSGGVHSVAFSSDGNEICSSCNALDRSLRIWSRGNFLQDDVTTVTAFSPKGDKIVSVSQEVVQLWDDAGRLPRVLLEGKVQGEARQIRFVCFSHDGSRVSALSSHTIYLWDTGNGNLLASSRVDEHSNVAFKSFYFTRDGSGLVITSSDHRRQLVMISSSDTEISRSGTEAFLLWGEVDAPRTSPIEDSPLFFDTSDKNQCHDNDFDTTTLSNNSMQWFPSTKPDFGLWAFIDNHIIRARKDGSMIIVPVWSSELSDEVPLLDLPHYRERPVPSLAARWRRTTRQATEILRI